MKKLFILFAIVMAAPKTEAQLLKKLKQKAEQAAEKAITKPTEKKEDPKENTSSENTSSENNNTSVNETGSKKDLKVYSKFDFVPGSTILYFDNFEKDNIGEAPLGWITSSSAEVVELEGIEGRWLKMFATNTKQITRNKKQSWGDNFTVEFDLIIVKKDYDPRISFALLNSAGNLVTDEKILKDLYYAVYVSIILADAGKKTRASLSKDNALGKSISDGMNPDFAYTDGVPVHVSMAVQGKRFRFWWNEKKIYDNQIVNPAYLPNQFGFDFGPVGGSDFFVSNIRIAKDVPDIRAKMEEGKLVSNLLFYSGTSNLKPESMGTLLDISKALKEASSPVKIVGHTDADSDDASNQKLSEQRAATVKQILVSQYGIDESKLTTEGRGETQPIADNKSPEDKAQNRRVEFIFKAEADNYIKPAGVETNTGKTNGAAKPVTNSSNTSGSTMVKLQSKTVNVDLPFAQIMKTGDNSFTFSAGKEEGNFKENFIKISLASTGEKLSPGTYNFKEVNEKNSLYGTKKFPEITQTEAILFYGGVKKPYIYKFSPIIANGHMASYVDEALIRKLPAVSPNSKLVIEKVENGKASGYFVFGMMNKGLKPITKGDAMTETFTDGFAGELKCTFTNVPIN